jgi:hypothetical protein
MTYEERKEEAMKMTLEDLIGGYHSAIDKAENRKNTNISLQYLLDERHLQIEALYDTVQDLTDERDKLKTEVNPDEPKTWQQEAIKEVTSIFGISNDRGFTDRINLPTHYDFDEAQQEAAIKTARQVEQPGTVTITRKEYGALLASRDMLEALEAAGVDNWSGYPDAMASLKAA